MSSVARQYSVPLSVGAGRSIQLNGTDYLGLFMAAVGVATWGVGYFVGIEHAIAGLAFVGFAAAILGLGYPALGLFGIGILCLMDTPMRYALLNKGGLLRWNTYNYWLVIVLVLYSPFLLRVRSIQWVIWQALILLMIIQLSYSPEAWSGAQQIMNLLALFSLSVFFARAIDDHRAWFWLGMILGLVGTAGGLVFVIKGAQYVGISINQWVRFPLTAVFAICLAMQFGVTRGRERGQALLFLLATINVGWVFLAGSRGAIIMGLMCLVFLMTRIRGRGAWLKIAGGLAAMVVCACLLFPERVEATLGRFELLFNSQESTTDRTSGRSDLFVGGWYMFLDNPLGSGTGGFETGWSHLAIQGQMSGYRAGEEFPAHSGWIKTLVENGVLGVVLFTAFVASFLVTGIRQRYRGVLGFTILISAMLAFSAITTEFQGKGLMMLTAGAIVMLHSGDFLTAWQKSIKTRFRPMIRRREGSR